MKNCALCGEEVIRTELSRYISGWVHKDKSKTYDHKADIDDEPPETYGEDYRDANPSVY